ncbi:hypothetical protein [Streptomyces sp. SH5]|uniref:hypothetical protein n=1 Tax=Streptomyces sp. SH5 TaxID=3041765 RepID=UPI002477D1FF|nr:hypothetical protein [Streptomyces sp. SH5]WGP11624.1 hypothetical protein QFA72_19100 [Streptomyces sp. SH5]
MNDGPEKTPHTDPHTDPDRPQGEGKGPGGSGTPGPDSPPARVDSQSAEDPDERGPGPTAATSTASDPADASTPAGAGSPDLVAGASAGGNADTGTESGAGARTGSGAGARTEAADDDFLATLTDLFADDRRAATDRSAADRSAAGRSASDRSAADRSAAGPSGELDEVALRRMLHGAVRDITPSEGTLDHLHRAVPARRARRRQAVVGAAAAALLIGTAIPAFVHVATSDGSATHRPAIAGHGEQAQGGNGEEPGPEEPGRQSVRPTERRSEGGQGEAAPDPSPSRGEGSDPDAEATGEETGSPSADLASRPACDPGQLGVASASTDAPGADGTVYGSFRIANVSGTDCTVSSNGTVGYTALGAADSQKIVVVQHAAGDAAPGLPDPSQEPGTVLLKPAMAYEVRFAWVPTDTCPTVGPSPTPSPSADGAGGTEGEAPENQAGVDPQSLYEDGGGTVAEGSVAVTHTPESGAPTAQTEIPNACSGTIYRTGVLATS